MPGNKEPSLEIKTVEENVVKFSDQDVLNKMIEHLDYKYNELGVTPHYISSYHMTPEEAENEPKSPLMNW